MSDPAAVEKLRENFERLKKIIQAEEMWERVPADYQEFSPDNLREMVKFAYFGGFIDVAQVREFLGLKRGEFRKLLPQWYEEVRQKGCWLC